MICTSMCRAEPQSSSANRSALPNPACASAAHAFIASAIWSAEVTSRMPRPPPPATALIITPDGCAASSWATCASSTPLSVASSTGTSAAIAARLADALSPNVSRASADGPTNRSPAAAQARAKRGSSLRNPYPG
ncbi:Uncharacterised protein [Mycobacteroides abscessus subsp. abscessus]|nr:Uncharacterised protein [Mycobacteroides abscessus subsp. abscessus]